MEIKYINYIKFGAYTFKTQGGLEMCYLCLEHGHTSKYCGRENKCGWCAENHWTHECPNKEVHTPKCFYCGKQGHASTEPSCPKRIELRDKHLKKLLEPKVTKPRRGAFSYAQAMKLGEPPTPGLEAIDTNSGEDDKASLTALIKRLIELLENQAKMSSLFMSRMLPTVLKMPENHTFLSKGSMTLLGSQSGATGRRVLVPPLDTSPRVPLDSMSPVVRMSGATTSAYKVVINAASKFFTWALDVGQTNDYGWRSYKEWLPPNWEGKSKTCQSWLETRKDELKEGELWRIHDKLYDLTDFIQRHPGGSFWLDVTKGTDITEAFECHHINDNAYKLLPKYFVKEALTKRNSPFTFEPDGFYQTLKKRVAQELKNNSIKPGPDYRSKMMIDIFCAMAFLLAIISARYQIYILVIPASLFLTWTVISAHNFFHQRDNWRMYLFNLSLLSMRDWRISHAMSHHIYPNTLHDLEITMFEPWFQYLPRADKTFAARFISIIYAPLAYSLIFFGEGISRLMLHPDGVKELIPLTIPASLMVAGVPMMESFLWWGLIVLCASLVFGIIGLNAAHHHPNIFHDGDEPRQDRDWGLYQLDAVKDRIEVKGSPFLVLTLFGDHTLHHLFPTIDHAHLNHLYPVLEKTCKEFGFDFQLTTTWDLIIGQFKQLGRITIKKRTDVKRG